MSKGLRNRVLLIVAIIAGCVLSVWPLDKRINLGLDLRGGMHLVMKVDTSKLSENAKSDAVARAMEILRNRIDSLGVGETVVQRQGEDQILVQLPGVTDRDSAVDMVKRVAHLEFRVVKEDPALFKDALAGKVVDGYEIKYVKGTKAEPLLVESKAVMQGDSVSDAKIDFDQSSFYPKISLTFNSQGAKDFAELTQKHVGERLAIVMDGDILSAPNIREPILTGTAEITGQFTDQESSMLALALRSGSLPCPMSIEEERTIGPLLGKDSIDAGIKAMLIGTLAVFAFMIFYYFIGGVIASFALFLNLLITIGIMGFISIMMPGSMVTLTLPGIAGLALTLGMAVDANVLINERIREELDNGKALGTAINAGYERALSAIIDSNLTTIIAAFMLFQFGSGPIKGFAITLTIGLMASLFTAVYVTRTVFMFLMEQGLIKSLPMMRLIGVTKIDFLKRAPFFIAVSFLISVAGLGSLVMKKDQAYGIDFAGGQVQEYHFAKAVSAEAIRRVIKDSGVKDAVIQQFDKAPENVIIRTSEDSYDKVQAAFKAEFKDIKIDTMRIEKVGPVVGKHLREQAVWALLLALAGIMIYVGFRFKHFDFAVAGVIALLHDVLIAMGLTVLFGRQIDLLVITALLTVAGYSINDTIVIYDRVRENFLRTGRKGTLSEVINLSINQTLGRTLLTSFVTMLVVFSLFFMGGEVLNTFSLTLLIGFSAGIYSTIFVVSPIVVWVQKFSKKSW
ncbi:MAG: protein translocase subunit SecD [Candidatus Omnitrophica bacterium]|nr:protein translocase subunit SecD [Candidatus Omnitrophota bacterium]